MHTNIQYRIQYSVYLSINDWQWPATLERDAFSFVYHSAGASPESTVAVVAIVFCF